MSEKQERVGGGTFAGPQPQGEMQKQNSYYSNEICGKREDVLYREPKDGTISLRNNSRSIPLQQEIPGRDIPKIELVTLIDISTLWDEKQQ